MIQATIWQRAASFAARVHHGHFRKDGVTPYFAHPCRVAMVVRHVFGCDDEVAIAAAFLHDTIEDTTTDYDDIEENFGAAVADAVAAMSKNMLLPESAREKDYDQRLAAGPWQSRLIKLADVYDNSIDVTPGTEAAEKFIDKRRRALELAKADSGPVFERAIAAVRTLEPGA